MAVLLIRRVKVEWRVRQYAIDTIYCMQYLSEKLRITNMAALINEEDYISEVAKSKQVSGNACA